VLSTSRYHPKIKSTFCERDVDAPFLVVLVCQRSVEKEYCSSVILGSVTPPNNTTVSKTWVIEHVYHLIPGIMKISGILMGIRRFEINLENLSF